MFASTPKQKLSDSALQQLKQQQNLLEDLCSLTVNRLPPLPPLAKNGIGTGCRMDGHGNTSGNGSPMQKLSTDSDCSDISLTQHLSSAAASDVITEMENDDDVTSNDRRRSQSPKKAPPPMIVISNRLPFVLKRDSDGILSRKASAGGLVTAVAPVVIENNGLWIGWTGLHDYNENIDRIPESDPTDLAPTAGLLSKQAVPVAVEPKLFDLYYNGCCNETYWPLFHSMPDRAIFNTDYWNAYKKVNELFAERTVAAIRQLDQERHLNGDDVAANPPIVWVHDYHLMLAANTIRNTCEEEGLKIKMGFFLHIPFPTFDIIRIFPWVDEMLMGMLGCDLVGFHISDYCVNFVDCCHRLLGCRIDRSNQIVYHNNRRIVVRALPIGIPYKRFEALSKTAKRVYPANDVRVILGVDRLDYTKGLVARLRALDKFFETYPQWIGKVTFLQVAVPSRTDVLEYQELKATIDKMVGAINGKYSSPAWSPIRYIFGSVSQNDLVAFYRDADVALVTPLRDGMNLVCKEFVAAQDDDDPGVLILSPFAGAGGLMHEALMANPYETLNVATAVNRALNMQLDERQLRMNQLKKRERKMDVDAWVKDFLFNMENLDNNGGCLDNDEFFSSADIESHTKLGIVIDFDGTLSYLARTPELALLPPETKKVLERLSNMTDVNIVIISGREMEDLRRKVGVDGISYAANHGLNIMHPDGHRYQHKIPEDYILRLKALKDELKGKLEKSGAWVEDKGLLVAWHYRELQKELREGFVEEAKGIYEKHGFETFTVSKRLENIAPEGWNRGDSAIHILRSLYGVDWEDRVKVIYAGDSSADELAIERLKGVASTFRVTNEDTDVITKTTADYRLAGPGGVLLLLQFLEKRLLGKTPKTSMSRASSVISVDRDFVEIITNEIGCGGNGVANEGYRPRTNSLEHRNGNFFRRRAGSQGSSGTAMPINSQASLRKRTLNHSLQNRLSRDEVSGGSSDSP